MADPDMPTLSEVRRWLAEQSDPDSLLNVLGLYLYDHLEHGGHWCTPTNSVAFASTGGDGVHFSFVDLGDGAGESSPVVMTVPMSSDPNWILGEDLLEFLALGLRSGYFMLGSLAYGADWEADIEGSAEPELLRELAVLRDRLDLRPWASVDAGLSDLDERYGDALIVAELSDQPDEFDQ